MFISKYVMNVIIILKNIKDAEMIVNCLISFESKIRRVQLLSPSDINTIAEC